MLKILFAQNLARTLYTRPPVRGFRKCSKRNDPPCTKLCLRQIINILYEDYAVFLVKYHAAGLFHYKKSKIVSVLWPNNSKAARE